MCQYGIITKNPRGLAVWRLYYKWLWGHRRHLQHASVCRDAGRSRGNRTASRYESLLLEHSNSEYDGGRETWLILCDIVPLLHCSAILTLPFHTQKKAQPASILPLFNSYLDSISERLTTFSCYSMMLCCTLLHCVPLFTAQAWTWIVAAGFQSI